MASGGLGNSRKVFDPFGTCLRSPRPLTNLISWKTCERPCESPTRCGFDVPVQGGESVAFTENEVPVPKEDDRKGCE
jgi:hypothetical protein